MLVIVVLCPVVGCITHFVIEYDIIIIKFLCSFFFSLIIWKRSLKLSVSYRVAYLAQSEHGLINRHVDELSEARDCTCNG